MQRYESVKLDNPDEHEKLVQVSSKLCRYSVLFDEQNSSVTILGPGVRESSEMKEPEFDSLEDAAIYYILLFESGLWPE